MRYRIAPMTAVALASLVLAGCAGGAREDMHSVAMKKTTEKQTTEANDPGCAAADHQGLEAISVTTVSGAKFGTNANTTVLRDCSLAELGMNPYLAVDTAHTPTADVHNVNLFKTLGASALSTAGGLGQAWIHAESGCKNCGQPISVFSNSTIDNDVSSESQNQ